MKVILGDEDKDQSGQLLSIDSQVIHLQYIFVDDSVLITKQRRFIIGRSRYDYDLNTALLT